MTHLPPGTSRRVVCRALLLGGAAVVAGCDTTESPGPAGTGGMQEARPVPAVDGVVAAFGQHRVVAIGETHGSLDLHDFLLTLVRDARFAAAAQVVAVEVGSSAQPAIDAYLDHRLGDDALLAALRDGIYSDSGAADPRTVDLYRAVRDANSNRKPEHRTRIRAADAPLSWRRVPASDTLDKDRETAMADVIRTSVLDRRRRVLWVVGGAHLAKGAARGILEGHLDQSIYTLSLYTGFGKQTRQLERRTAGWPVPSVIPIPGTWLSQVAELGNPNGPTDVMVPVAPSEAAEPPPGSAPPAPPGLPAALLSPSELDALLFLGRCGALRAMLPPHTGSSGAVATVRRCELIPSRDSSRSMDRRASSRTPGSASHSSRLASSHAPPSTA